MKSLVFFLDVYSQHKCQETLACADPGIFVRGQGGGGPGQSDKKKAPTTFFFFVFFSPQLILQTSNGQF